MPHTQKSQAEKAQEIVVSQGGVYAKNPWVPAVTKPLANRGQ